MANSTTQFGGFLTNIGIAQQANSAALGVPWNITHMLIGDAGGDPSESPEPTPKPTQTALVRQVLRAQLNALYPSPADPAVLVAELVLPPEVGGWWIRELALEDANGNFVAVAKPAPSYKPLLAQGSGRTQTIRMHVVFGNVANINLKIDPSIVLATREYVDKAREAAELYARNQLKAHTDAANPHPQYLLRSAVAKDSGPLAWLGDAAGTANALALTLKHSEATLTAYAAGQRFQFKATASNTGPVTAKIGALAAVAVKKSEGNGLVDLVGGDIRAGALYDLNFDGTYFQLGGGVGAGKAFERFSFEASVGQSVFAVPHTVGNIIVMRNGREVSEFVSDGVKVTLQQPCEFGDSVQVLAFSSFQAVNTYTKAEVDTLLTASAGLPVGTMLPFPQGTVPPGFLEVDGSVQSAAAYPDLAAYLGAAFNKGGEGAGYFRLPDSRGEFLRGWDHGRGVDSGRAVGSTQLDALQNITGSLDLRRLSGGESLSGVGHGVLYNDQASSNAGTRINVGLGTTALANDSLSFDASRSVRTATETRPRNLAVMWCIKAWNTPVNQGQINIGALVEELAALRSSTPIGAILPFPRAEVPAGYLELDGSVHSSAAYPDLSAYLDTAYNKGNEPAGYFRLPDYRGEFLRGWDHGRGVDVGRGVGSYQADELRSHDHLAYSIDKYSSPATLGASGAAAPHNIGNSSGIRTGMTGGSETRPRNLAVMWCIKAWNAPVSQGQVDIAALAPLAGQANETKLGTAKIAPQTQVDEGLVDDVIVTPKKLRMGFSYQFDNIGYIAFPSWLGGFLMQWGVATTIASDNVNATFPIPFNQKCFRVFATHGTGGTPAATGSPPGTLTGVNLRISVSGASSIGYLAIGK